MFDWIIVNVVHMFFKSALFPDLMYPIAALPDTAFALTNPTGANKLGFFQST